MLEALRAPVSTKTIITCSSGRTNDPETTVEVDAVAGRDARVHGDRTAARPDL